MDNVDELVGNELSTENKNKYEERIKEFADNLQASITQLKDKAKEVKDSATDTYSEKVEALDQKRNDLMEEYHKIKGTGEEKWHQIKEDSKKKIDSIRDETRTAYTGIRDGFSYLFKTLKES